MEGMSGSEIEVLGYRGMKEYEIAFDDFKVKKACNELPSSAKWDKHLKRTEFICSRCNVFLCAAHFEVYHDALLGSL